MNIESVIIVLIVLIIANLALRMYNKCNPKYNSREDYYKTARAIPSSSVASLQTMTYDLAEPEPNDIPGDYTMPTYMNIPAESPYKQTIPQEYNTETNVNYVNPNPVTKSELPIADYDVSDLKLMQMALGTKYIACGNNKSVNGTEQMSNTFRNTDASFEKELSSIDASNRSSFGNAVHRGVSGALLNRTTLRDGYQNM